MSTLLTAFGWTVMIRRKDGSEFMAVTGDQRPVNVGGRLWCHTRKDARRLARDLREHGMETRVCQCLLRVTEVQP